MQAIRNWMHALTLLVVGAIGVIATPVHAQLAAGCTCPAGFAPQGSVCVNPNLAQAQPVCPSNNIGSINNNIGSIAASQQQLSFWGVRTMLEQRRDQLQGTVSAGETSSRISGYAPFNFGDDMEALGYSGQSQQSNPLAAPVVYKATPAATPANPVWGAWVQGLADWERDNPLSAIDVGRFTATYAAQGGFDRTWQGVMSSDDALVVGIVSSWTSARSSFDNTPTIMHLIGPGVGVYSQYVKGGFSTDLTTKFDFLQMTQDFAGTAPNTSIGLTNAGVSGNTQYKFAWAGSNFVEPTAGFTFTRTIFGSGAAALELQDADTVRLQAGSRFGTTWNANGLSIDASIKALVYSDVIAQGTSIAGTVLTPTVSPTDEGLVRGELDPEMMFALADGYSVTLSGKLRFGEGMVGGSAGINLRKQF
jgi:hypothetical protein